MKVRLPYPHPGQRTVRRQARRFNWLSAGRRWRKTTMCMSIAVEAALAGQQIVWGAPVYDQVFTGWLETQQAAGNVADFNVSRMTATFPGRGAIIYRSLDDPDNVRSKTADGVVIDECGDVMEAAWYEALRPMLMDTGGWAWGIGTPKGRNWFWREHAKARDEDGEAMSWQAPTLGARIVGQELVREPHPLENPDIAWGELLSLWQTMPERSFRQEILAEFMEDAGGVFRGVRGRATEKPRLPYDGVFVMGLDWAQQKDFTVLTVLDARSRKMVDLDRFNQVDWALQRGRVKAMADKWDVERIIAEKNSIGGPNIEALQREGLPVLPFETTAQSKPPLIESLALAFERGEIAILDDPVLVDELEAYERTVSEVTGRARYNAPEGGHDDCVMALALAWWGVVAGGPKSRTRRAA